MPAFSTPYDPPIPATDIHDGSVSNAEFGYLNGVTSAIQTQIDGKAASSHSHSISDVTGLQSALDGKSSTSHNHSGVYEASGAVSTHAAVTSGVHGITPFAATILDDADAATVRGTIGLGSIATQSAGAVAITGGTISGITDLAIADGGTGASSASAARNNLSVYSTTEVDALIDQCQLLDNTLTALAGWSWSSGREVPTFTAADTLSVLRVGTSANNLVQLTGDGKLPAVDGSLLTGISGGGGASAIDDLSDVTITAAASGDFLRHNGTAWVDATISASDIPSGVDAVKIGAGSVSNTEFGYLDGVTSAIQTQLDAKAGTATIGGFSKPVYGADTANVWLGPPGLNHTGAPLSANVIYAVRIFVDATRTFTKMRCAVGVAWSAGSTLRMAIVNETASCTPGTLILDSGTIAADSTGFKDFAISQSLSPGWYWLLWSTNGTGGQISAGTAASTPNGVLTSTATSSGNIQFLSRSLTYAAYGDQTGATWTVTFNGNPPRLLIQ